MDLKLEQRTRPTILHHKSAEFGGINEISKKTRADAELFLGRLLNNDEEEHLKAHLEAWKAHDMAHEELDSAQDIDSLVTSNREAAKKNPLLTYDDVVNGTSRSKLLIQWAQAKVYETDFRLGKQAKHKNINLTS